MYDKHTLTFVSFEYSSDSVPDMAPHRLNPQDSSAVLRTLDLFSGTGGLSHALAEEIHGRVEVAHAIDVNVNAALTLK
jgi:methylase of polypeptide subunit release factors